METATREVVPHLSPREWSILDCLTDGLTNRAIAQRLILSEFYVRDCVSRLLLKYGVRNRTELAAAYLRKSQTARDAHLVS